MNSDLDVACHLNVLMADAESDRLGAALDAVADAGYRRVVLPPLDPDATHVAALARLFADRGLTPITIAGQTPVADVSSADPHVRAAGVERLRSVLRVTSALGGDQMNGVPYGQFGGPTTTLGRDAFLRAASEVGRVADEAHAQGVTMTFEVLNRYETSVINTAAQAMDFVASSGSEHLRIHLDTFHMAVEESDLAAAIRTALPRLGFLELGQSGRGALAHGTVDIVEVVRQSLDDGYEGRWGVEAFSRSVLAPSSADMLSIWRAPYDDGVALAVDALRVIDEGWAVSTVGRARRMAHNTPL